MSALYCMKYCITKLWFLFNGRSSSSTFTIAFNKSSNWGTASLWTVTRFMILWTLLLVIFMQVFEFPVKTCKWNKFYLYIKSSIKMLFCFYVFNDYLRGRLWFFSKLYCLMCSKGFSLCKLRGKIKLLSANTSVRHSASSCSAPLFDRSMSKRSKRRPCTSLLSRAISRSRVNARCNTLLCPVYWSCYVRT